ncbi:cation diffusion facilitator family transporter [Thermanaeromonas toyohensis ToBE]|uniref:Cation diffusion facilitator family transporter n=1 Tax=Thermanaeromonas toyohensis ToBE TaxID=698762 RepID=A0A1W1VZT2_9FIRM|nr:cation diffusion facilitator family transporter [Thermanaeromonas toyohensis]SMB98848.1 cation diffusion facilitator family transporter [Thermanaeromonas toyohensis ToBE]
MAVDERLRAARVSVFSNISLVVLKLFTGVATGSLSIVSEAIHSGLDLMASVLAYFSLKEATKPADYEHRYGHGKIENIAGALEALLVFVAAMIIIIEALKKLKLGAEVSQPVTGMVVMGLSAGVNYQISRHLFKVAKATQSVALEADAWHLLTDVYTSVGVMLGLGILKVTGFSFMDPLVALLVAGLILRAAYQLMREAFLPLMDVCLPAEEERLVKEIISAHAGEYVEFHKLRTRKSGRERQIDLHLVVPARQPVVEAHRLCDRITSEIKAALPYTHVLIHIEPCREDKDCDRCPGCQEER